MWRESRRIIWGSFKFHNAFGDSIRLTPAPPRIVRDVGDTMRIRPGTLTIEMTRTSIEPFKMVVYAEMFVRFLMQHEGSIFVFGGDDRKLQVGKFKKNANDYDCWRIFDTVSKEYVICGFDPIVLTQTKSLVKSLFYWSYGFNFLVPRKIEEKSSNVFVKHRLIRDKKKRLELTFAPPKVNENGVISHGGIFLTFKEQRTSLDFELDISDVSRLFGYGFEKSLEFTNDSDIVLHSSYDSKLNVHFLTAQRKKLRICFIMSSSEFQQFRWVLTTAIPVITGFDCAFEGATSAYTEIFDQERGTSFLNFRLWKMRQRDHDFHV